MVNQETIDFEKRFNAAAKEFAECLNIKIKGYPGYLQWDNSDALEKYIDDRCLEKVNAQIEMSNNQLFHYGIK